MQFTLQNLLDSIAPYLPQVPRQDRKVLVICITAAFLFWLVVNLGREYTINKEVLVHYEVPNDQVLRGSMTQIADLAVTGQGWNLLREGWRNPVIEVSLPVIEQEDGRISKSDIARLIEPRLSSSSLTITDFTFVPTSIVLEPKATKLVPVRLLSNVEYDQGHVPISQLLVLPDSVMLRGPREALDSLNVWYTDTLTKLN
ncbi:MAG: hypothetical protein AAFQ37_03840, partial [Bacteroidota bacterium]